MSDVISSFSIEETLINKLPVIEQLRIITLEEASRLSGVSKDSLTRNHRNKIIKLSTRRLGMRVRDALMLRGDE